MTEPKFSSMHEWLRYTNARYAAMARQAELDAMASNTTHAQQDYIPEGHCSTARV